MKPKRFTKEEALGHWEGLSRVNPAKKMSVIPYKASGSKYGTCGIRIDGTRKFIDAVLSNLKPLLALESDLTRLELNYTEVTTKDGNYPTGDWVCYIRCHERGREAQMCNLMVKSITESRLQVSRNRRSTRKEVATKRIQEVA